MATFSSKLISLCLGLFFFILCHQTSNCSAHPMRKHNHWPSGGTTRFYDFKIQRTRVTKVCKSKEIITVNGMFPGPAVYAHEGDRVIIRVTNETPQNATIHWHGIFQRLSCWADGPVYVTQCPIRAGQTYTYEFTIVEQRGTFFWHAHVSWLRATVHGALIVYPKKGVPYPFPHPYEEHILVFEEYFFRDTVRLERAILRSGGAPPAADAYMINGKPGPRYNCSLGEAGVNDEL